ncbi:MAG TPA: FtsX-like permease family protein [Acidobacteriota bacterium]|nr:FtsX-like permease family protein [Acidobacteriota bacterium]
MKPLFFPRLRNACLNCLRLQIAACLTLTLGASLFAGTVYNYSQIDHGLNFEGVATVRVEPGLVEKSAESILRAYQRLDARLAGGPGIAQHSLAEIAPFEQTLRPVTLFAQEQRHQQQPRKSPAMRNHVSGKYFETLGLGLLEGRSFRDSEVFEPYSQGERVGIINRSTAQRLWPAGSALGRVLYVAESQQEVKVIGVVADHQIWNLRKSTSSVLYEPLGQAGFPPPQASLILKIDRKLSAILPFVQQQMGVVVPGLAAHDGSSLQGRINSLLAEERLLAQATVMVAAAALLFSCAGLFASMISSVRRRSHELGIRLALGASAGRIGWLVCSRAVWIFVAGAGLGAILSYWLSGLLEGKIFGISALDPAVCVITLGLLAVAVGLAAYLPLRRALRLDPARTLKSE